MKLNNKILKNENMLVEHAPFMHDNIGISKIMGEVILALLPALAVAACFFGMDALKVIAVSVVSCVLAEFIWQKVFKISVTILDLSAVVTGLLLALTLPAKTPLWIVSIAGIFSIVLIKQAFGGLGHNIFNPALAGRVFIEALWPHDILNWQVPLIMPASLDIIKLKLGKILPMCFDLIINNQAGNIGEVSIIALLLGALFLVMRKHIFAVIPVVYVGTVLIGAFALGQNVLVYALNGGLFLGGFYMAADPVTSPLSSRGKMLSAFFCGMVTLFFGLKGVYFSILLMNAATPLFDKYTLSKPFGLKNKWF